MLSLTREEGQSIIIDGRIEVRVVRWSRTQVRLVIVAPEEMKILRNEHWPADHPGQLTPLEQDQIKQTRRKYYGKALTGKESK